MSKNLSPVETWAFLLTNGVGLFFRASSESSDNTVTTLTTSNDVVHTQLRTVPHVVTN